MKKLLIFLFISIQFISYGQINGVVIDAFTGEHLIGSNVIIKSTNNGTATDINGSFIINNHKEFPIEIKISFLGYKSKDIIVKSRNPITIKLYPDSEKLNEVKVIDSRVTQKQKEAALSIVSLDINSIKETPSVNFYEGLGSLKGVDITSASLGFKVINTRGFNSTSPVRSLQIIDGVDNQSPGLNFSLGNFLGSSELDIMKVDIIQGASSSYYGPNAFNGVISMKTLSPFVKPGVTVQYKFGSRRLFENSLRIAERFKDKNDNDLYAFKLNISYMQALDWEANNLATVDGSPSIDNPGGYDAVNRYGDEHTGGNLNNVTDDFRKKYIEFPGLGNFYRTGYIESDIVDYNTKNLKAQGSFHYKLNKETELIYSLNYSTGTTVYQGDNRFSLKNIQFWQNKIELFQKDKFFIRAYRTQEDAGDSYDAVFTAVKLQEHNLIDNNDWYTQYKEVWRDNFSWSDLNWSVDGPFYDPLTQQSVYEFNGLFLPSSDYEIGQSMTDSVLNANIDYIISTHNSVRQITDSLTNRLTPGTELFNNVLEEITSKTALEGGTGFYDKSALNHIHSEYQINNDFGNMKFGANFRQYTPDTKGSLFIDTNSKIKNHEFGVYTGIEKSFLGKTLKLSATIRADKNENFNLNYSPATSIVYKPSQKDFIRLSLSSAIRNPTLADQYLYYNAGRAILIGNLDGHGVDYGENLVTIESIIDYYLPATPDRNALRYFSIKPIQPEKAKSLELGYRTTIFDKVYLDATYYYTKYEDFIGYKVGAKFLADTSNGGFLISLPSIQAYRMAANASNTVTTQGASAGINYYFHSNFSLNGNYSWNKLNEKGTNDPIIPAYNTPEHKFNLGISGKDIHFSSSSNVLRDYSFNINYKWVDEFMYEGSPQFTGIVPSYDVLDLQLSKSIRPIDAIVKIGSSNVLNNEHFEVFGGPYIGRMIYCSLLINIK